MPLIKVATHLESTEDSTKKSLTLELSQIVADGIGKPETYVAVVLEEPAMISFGGEIGQGAFVEVRSIGGLNKTVNNQLAQSITSCLKSHLSIEPERVYINFIDMPRTDWAWKGATFG